MGILVPARLGVSDSKRERKRDSASDRSEREPLWEPEPLPLEAPFNPHGRRPSEEPCPSKHDEDEGYGRNVIVIELA